MPKAWTRLCLHPFHRGEVLLQGLNCCSLLETQQPVPASPREGGRSKPAPARARQYLRSGWQHPNTAMAAPQRCYGSPGNVGAEQQPSPPHSLLSVCCSWEVQLYLLCYSSSSSSSQSPSASSLPAKLPPQALCPQPTAPACHMLPGSSFPLSLPN